MTHQSSNPAIVELSSDEQKQVKGGEILHVGNESGADGLVYSSGDQPLRPRQDGDGFMSMNQDPC